MATYEQPKTGIGSTAETNRLLGGKFFDENTGGAVDINKNTQEQNQALANASPAAFDQFANNARWNTSAINSQTLSGNATPYQLPPPPPPKYQPPVNVPPPSGATTGAGGVASVNPPTTQPAPKGSMDWVKEQFGKLGDALGTKADETKRIQEETQLFQKRESQARSYNALVQAKKDLEDQVGKLAGMGLTDTQRVAQEREIRRVGNANISNLAIQAQADQNLLSAAEQTVKDKIDAQFSPITDQIDFLTKMSTVLSNDLTESESLQLQSQIEEKRTGRENITKTAETLHQNMIANGAPATTYSALDKISEDYIAGRITAQEAQSRMYQAAGQYGVKPLTETERANLANIYSQIAERNASTAATAGGGVVVGTPGTKPTGKADPIAAGYATRTVNADKIIDELGSRFVKTSSLLGKFAPDVLKSSERLQYEQAQRNFVNAVLRKESGAAISDTEFENARKQYFPQPGDTQDVILQKKANRVDSINALIGSAGKAFDGTYLSYPDTSKAVDGLLNGTSQSILLKYGIQ